MMKSKSTPGRSNGDTRKPRRMGCLAYLWERTCGLKPHTQHAGTAVPPAGRASGRQSRVGSMPASPQVDQPTRGKRFVIWVDRVGGFLVCEGNEVSLGQPVPGVDIPILGDLSRRHATIRRSGEGYVIDPRRDTSLDGRPLTAATALCDGQLLKMGRAVALYFRKPSPLSGTARLELASRHRTQPPVDGVLLMADCVIVGPGPQSHIVCPRWDQQLILYHSGGQLYCRSPIPLTVDGVEVGMQAAIHRGARITADSVTFVLEELADETNAL